jgi:hypothetical protein
LYWPAQDNASQVSLSTTAASFVASPEFIKDYGPLTDAAFVNQVYENLQGTTGDPAGTAYRLNLLASGTSRASVLLTFSECQQNRTNTIWTGGDVDNAEVYRLYQRALGRIPDAAGLATGERRDAGSGGAGFRCLRRVPAEMRNDERH